MISFRLLITSLVVLAVGGSAQAQDNPDWAKMIVGTWEVTKGDMSTVQEGSVFVFDKEGNVTLHLVFGKQKAKFEATYKIEGDILSTQVKGVPGPARTQKLLKISDKELSWEEKSKKITELKKK